MRPWGPAATAAGLLLACACSAADPAPPSPPGAVPPTPTGTVVQAPNLPREPLPTPADEYPLEALSPAAAALVRAQGGAMGVAVAVPGRGRVYTYAGDQPFHMASMIKVVILLAALDQAAREGRDLTADERDLLEPMITWSDNDAADLLWWRLGGGDGIAAYLERVGISGIEPDALGYWGDSTATPKAVALLLARLVWGDLLGGAGRDYAMTLLEQVTPAQRWGVAGPGAAPPQQGMRIGIKDGWYPEEEGWEVNSAGFFLPSAGGGYTIAVLSSGQQDFEEAVGTIERVAALVHAALAAVQG